VADRSNRRGPKLKLPYGNRDPKKFREDYETIRETQRQITRNNLPDKRIQYLQKNIAARRRYLEWLPHSDVSAPERAIERHKNLITQNEAQLVALGVIE
jgi:hypothetical protein